MGRKILTQSIGCRKKNGEIMFVDWDCYGPFSEDLKSYVIRSIWPWNDEMYDRIF